MKRKRSEVTRHKEHIRHDSIYFREFKLIYSGKNEISDCLGKGLKHEELATESHEEPCMGDQYIF